MRGGARHMMYFPLLTALLLLSSCAVGPDYKRPSVEVPKVYKETSRGDISWKVGTPKDTADKGAWWQIFQDSELDSLEIEATTANQSIAVLEAQYEQARALVQEARAGFFPTLASTLTDTKSLGSSNIATSQLTSSKPVNTAAGAFQASWEPDLWGNIRRLVESDEAAAQATAAQLEAARLSTQATLAQTYFQLRALDETQSLLAESVTAYEKYLKIIKNQYNSGTTSRLAILQAETQLQIIRVSIIDNGVARAQYEHALAVLLGRPPATFSIAKRSISLTPPSIPVDIPSHLLERRPDIANAERLMAQANAQIGIATAAYYPGLTLSGTRGIQSQNFKHLFSNPISFWSLGAQLVETILDGGLRMAAVAAADANYKATVAQYRQTVLAAFQDVEDNLSTVYILQREMKAQEAVVTAAEKELKYIVNNYQAGTLNSTDVLTALYNVYSAKTMAITLSSRRLVAAVGLIRSLGGGFDPQSISLTTACSS